MENINIHELWKQNEAWLDSNRKLNATLLREVKLDKAKSSLKNLLFLPISTLIFFLFATSYALYFAVANWGTWYFMFSAAVVALFSVILVVSSVRQLQQIFSVDYNAPIVKLQKDISKIKFSVVTNLRIGAWILPFSPFIGLFIVKALFHFDMVEVMNYNMVVSFGIATIILEALSLMALRALRPKNINKRWLNWLLKGSGSQVDEALGFLKQIEEFEREEK